RRALLRIWRDLRIAWLRRVDRVYDRGYALFRLSVFANKPSNKALRMLAGRVFADVFSLVYFPLLVVHSEAPRNCGASLVARTINRRRHAGKRFLSVSLSH